MGVKGITYIGLYRGKHMELDWWSILRDFNNYIKKLPVGLFTENIGKKNLL